MESLHDFTTTYAGFNGKSYLSFSIPAQEELVEYQIEMLTKNRIDFLLPLSVQRLNNDWKLSYEITSKIPLGKVLERKSLKYEEFEYLIKQVGKITMKLKDYLLDISSVIFDKAYIYCDPGDLSLYFMYFPIKTERLHSDTMKDFLQKLIFEDIRLLDDSSGSLLKRLLDVLKSETFIPEQLLKCINSKQPEKQNHTYRSIDESDSSSNVVSSRQSAGEQKYPIPKINYRESIIKKHEKNDQTSNLKYPLKSYIVAGTVNIFLIGILFYVLFSKSGSNRTSTLLGLALIGSAINYFLVTRLFSEDKRTTDKEEISKPAEGSAFKRFANEAVEEDIILPKRRPVCIERKDTENRAFRDGYEYQNKETEPIEPVLPSDSTPEDFSEGSKRLYNAPVIQDKTVILGFAAGNMPYLQSHSHPNEKINIAKDSMLLGRLSDSVDYAIQNKAVGKIHAEIVKREDSYYIIDLNSVNGTYVNNERITCSTEVKLKNGDIITMANESYTFIL